MSETMYTPIRSLKPGMNNLCLMCIVLDVGKTSITKDSRSEVRTVRLADKTASINMSCWGEVGNLIQPGDIIRMTKGYTSLWKNCLTLYMGKGGEMKKIGEFCFIFSELPFMSESNNDHHQGGGGHGNGSGGQGHNNKGGGGGGGSPSPNTQTPSNNSYTTQASSSGGGLLPTPQGYNLNIHHSGGGDSSGSAGVSSSQSTNAECTNRRNSSSSHEDRWRVPPSQHGSNRSRSPLFDSSASLNKNNKRGPGVSATLSDVSGVGGGKLFKKLNNRQPTNCFQFRDPSTSSGIIHS